MVPVATAQVGWIVVLAVAATGAPAEAVIITAVTGEIQVLSAVLLTKILCEPAATPAKVTDAW